MTHEVLFAKFFITSEKRARWTQFLSNTKRRKEVLNRLSHDLPYIHELATEIPSIQDFPEELERLLKEKGAGPTCHVIVDGLKIDGHELPLTEAIKAVFLHDSGAILSCIPGRLAYYKPEPPAHGLILERVPR
ncbi:MAG: hypothetical protein H6Q00_3328 [Holophagaceae bacterium]|nr:hypothetical protein [Holophagaceae bacterium]